MGVQITHRGQHPYKHKAQEVMYKPLKLDVQITVKEALDILFGVGYDGPNIVFQPDVVGVGAGEVSNAKISNPPTQKELVGLLGQPSMLKQPIIDSEGKGEFVIKVYTTLEQKAWYYQVLLKAL